MISFSYELNQLNNDTAELSLVGYMDEQTVLPSIDQLINKKRLIVNFGRVQSILSMGVKLWIQFAVKLEELPHLQVEFKKCSKQIVDQINRVYGFLPSNGTVSSIFVPVHCALCQRNFKVLKKTDNIQSTIYNIISELEVSDCDQFPSCKKSFELECNPEAYLAFTRHLNKA